MATKKTTTKTTQSDPQPTIGEYIDSRLYSMAMSGLFDQFGPSTESQIPGIVQDYIEKWRSIRYV